MAKIFKLLPWHVRIAYLFNTTCNLLSISIGYLLPGTSQEKPQDNLDLRAMTLVFVMAYSSGIIFRCSLV